MWAGTRPTGPRHSCTDTADDRCARICMRMHREREYSALSDGGGGGRVFFWLVVCGQLGWLGRRQASCGCGWRQGWKKEGSRSAPGSAPKAQSRFRGSPGLLSALLRCHVLSMSCIVHKERSSPERGAGCGANTSA
eukprot:scaffold1567_cov106-Isochrysis_galbana.AAC.7